MACTAIHQPGVRTSSKCVMIFHMSPSSDPHIAANASGTDRDNRRQAAAHFLASVLKFLGGSCKSHQK